MEEIWKEIPGFKDYEASNLGNIRSWKNKKKGKLLRPAKNKYGYMHVVLYDENIKPRPVLVHRAVLSAFMGKNKLIVNHKDGRKDNNNIENLEYCTYSENSKHSFVIGIQDNKGEKHPRAVFTNDDIILIRKLHDEYKLKQTTIAWLFGKNPGQISDIAKRRAWGHI